MSNNYAIQNHENTHVYIAGPISINPDGYKEHFGQAEELMVSYGIPRNQIFNPAKNDEPQNDEDKFGQAAYRYFLEIDLTWICKHATVMYMLKDWEKSPGANAEHALAKALGMEIWYEA